MEKKNEIGIRYSDKTYVEGLGFESSLTKENCSPELWEELGGDGPELTEEDYQRFLNGEPFKN
jgi:hypothetical protein